MSNQDEILAEVRNWLETEHECHTIILYGSRARGDADTDSDYDIIAFRDGDQPVLRETGQWRGGQLDIFVYPTARLTNVDETLLHVRGGSVITVRGTLGAEFLAELERIYREPPPPLSKDEIDVKRNWAHKMVQRASRGDIEGNFRRAWLLTQLLQDYFLVRGRRYPGPKEAFHDLAESDPQALRTFRAALEPGSALSEISAAVTHVHGSLPKPRNSGRRG